MDALDGHGVGAGFAEVVEKKLDLAAAADTLGSPADAAAAEKKTVPSRVTKTTACKGEAAMPLIEYDADSFVSSARGHSVFLIVPSQNVTYT